MENSRIQVLSPKLANLIAAGEVVERPASVVKELVENSIDAQSSKIKVELLDCGLKKITVVDNGIGISELDLPNAVLPHATSKISCEEDLFKITTLGFRGEALPSIASVSDFTITSSTTGNGGYYYSYEYGKIKNHGLSSSLKGTMVEVKNLFFNTPARLKHLGSTYQELSAITDYFYKTALSHPNISFILTNNNKILFQSSGNGNIPDIMKEAYGSTINNSLIYFEGKNGLYHINGYTTNNDIFRSSRSCMTIIVNGRVIKNLALIYAIDDAYQTILTTGKHPITTLFIETDPSLIDVNVHPSKLEIRFTDEIPLKSLITNSIKLAIKDQELLKYQKPLTSSEEDNIPLTSEEMLNETDNSNSFEENKNDDLWSLFEEDEIKKMDNYPTETLKNELPKTSETFKQIKFHEQNREFFKNLHYLGQYHETYLLLEDEDILYLIDQHAAMERVMYEKISNALGTDNQSTYELMIPLTIEFSVKETLLIMENIQALNDLGISLDEFGNNTIIVRVLPTWIPNGEEISFLHDIIQHLIIDKPINKSIMYDNLAKKLSCKKSIKADMRIRDDEVKTLLKNLDTCEMPYTCPHGRPTIVKFTSYEIEKMFKRVI